MATLKPWREIAVPHEDVLKGTFQQAEFAADISRVHAGTATREYQDPALFFERTFITEGMRLLLDSVIRRLTGRGGDPVIQLQTAFGGGKTHTMLAVYHLAKSEGPISELPGVPPLLDAAGVMELPKARVVVLDGIQFSPSQIQPHGKTTIHTLWGELAWQLGGEAAYARIKEADQSGTSPGKEILASLLADYSPCVILIDELVAYLRQFSESKSYPGGTFDSNLTFVQALTEALKAAPTAMLLASLPESKLEVGSTRGAAALDALEKYFGRVQAIWKPVATEEAFEIVRRRLFNNVSDKAGAEQVCRAFADYYTANGADFPHETQESRYFERMMRAYPIHPEVFERLYEDWSSLDKFQRTRGVLKLMAKVIHRLWKDDNKDFLILPGSLPLYDADIRNEAIYYLPQGWDPVLERDVDGDRAETTDIERDTRFGSVQAARRVARSIFLGSAPSTPGQMVRGIEPERIMLGCAQPGQQSGVYKDVLRRLVDRLHYLNSANNRYWFDTRPNLRREMEERKRRFQDKGEVIPAIRERVQRLFGQGVFGGVHIFTPSGDVPDDWTLRLVVLSPDAAFYRSGRNLAIEAASEILKSRGDQPRQKQNRLIFLVADYDCVGRLKEQVRSLLAWQSIVADIKELKLNLDQYQARQAGKSLEDAQAALGPMIRETYRWLLAPMQEARPGKGLSEIQWESFQISASAPNIAQEIEHVLRDNELLITEWAPIHLHNILKTWFWKEDRKDVGALDIWQKTCCYLYLPRLKDDRVYQNALAAGARSTDFFGLAYGYEDGKYIGFSFGETTTPILDLALLLIEPHVSATYAETLRAAEAARLKPEITSTESGGTGQPLIARDGADGTYKSATTPIPQPTISKHQFYGTIELDPVKAKFSFAQMVDEVVQQFTTKHDVKVKISVEILAESSSGFDDGVQRVVKENCNVLKFKNAEFE
ncbi:MAG: ATP-binding protein [Gammaproteobacteria bacterium]|nr:ATP-binding protein [Gammaproteobacteria bacterium]